MFNIKNFKYLILLSSIVSGVIAGELDSINTKQIMIDTSEVNKVLQTFLNSNEVDSFIESYMTIIEHGKNANNNAVRQNIANVLINNRQLIIKKSEELLEKELNTIYYGKEHDQAVYQYRFPAILNCMKNKLDSLATNNNYDDFFFNNFSNADELFSDYIKDVERIIDKASEMKSSESLPKFNIIDNLILNIVLYYISSNNYFTDITVHHFAKNVLFAVHEDYVYDFFWHPVHAGILLEAIQKNRPNLLKNFIEQMAGLSKNLINKELGESLYLYMRYADPQYYTDAYYLKHVAIEETHKLYPRLLKSKGFVEQYISMISTLRNNDRNVKILDECVLPEIIKNLRLSDSFNNYGNLKGVNALTDNEL